MFSVSVFDVVSAIVMFVSSNKKCDFKGEVMFLVFIKKIKYVFGRSTLSEN